MVDIDELLARLNPKTAAAFKRASETNNDLLSTPSLGLNMAIGGFGYGRQTMLWGNKGGGKTAFCLEQAAIAQKDGKGVAWIDAEKNFDKSWARRLGVDPDQMILSKTTSIADVADFSYDLIRDGIDLLIIDSISPLLPQSYFDDGEIKPLSGTGQIGTFSKNMGTMCNMLNNVNDHTALIMISQVRNQFNSYGAALSHMGGKAVEHLNSTCIKLWNNPSDKELIKHKIAYGDILVEKPVGSSVAWTVDKSRGPGMKMSNKYDLYFAGDHVGIDRVGEVVDFGVQFGKIKKGGAWYTVGEERLQGRTKVVEYFRANPDIEEKFYNEILATV